jgi:hypothetical protein
MLVLAALGASALAEGPARVVLIGPSESDPTVVRLRRELNIVGIDVELVVATGEGHRDLGDVAREHHAPAVVAWEPSPPGIVLWIDPARAPQGDAGTEIRVDESEQRMLVLRAVEILRERLLPAPVPAPSSDAAPPAPDASASSPPPPSPTVSAAPAPAPTATAVPSSSPPPPSHRGPSAFAAPALLASPGGVGATPHVWLGARWAPLNRVDLELAGYVPTTAATVPAADGSMSLRVGAVVAGAGLKLTEPAGNLFVTAGAGLGAMVAGFEGQARPPREAAGGVRASMLPYVHALAGYWLLPRLALRADVMVGFALPEPVLIIAGQRVAYFGEPATLLAAGIEVRP